MKSENQSSTKVNSDEISMKDFLLKLLKLFRYLKSKWLPIGIIGILGCLAGFFYAKSIKPIYTATTTFVLEEDKSSGGLGSIAGIASMAGVDLGNGGGGIFQGENILELYKSRNMIEKTLLSEVVIQNKKELLINRYIAFNKLREKWEKNTALKNISFTPIGSSQVNSDRPIPSFSRLQDSVLREVVKDVNKKYLIAVKPDKKLSLINVSVNAEDEGFAKAFNEEIVKNVNDFYKQTKTKKSLENVIILQNKRDSVRRVMNGEIYNAARVADQTPNQNPTRMVQRLAPIQTSQFSAETNKAMLSQLVANLEMSKIALNKETPLLQIVDVPVLPLEKKGFGKFKGLVMGGCLFGLLAILFFSSKLMLKNILNDE